MILEIKEIDSNSPIETLTKPDLNFLKEVGEIRFRQLVDDHYEILKESDIAFMFPVDYSDEFAKVKKHAADFLIQVCGGPNYFEQTRGDSKMVARHTRFRINENGRYIWLASYKTLLEDLEKEGVDKKYIESFWNYLNNFSMVLVNI
jgi:hemoglobin